MRQSKAASIAERIASLSIDCALPGQARDGLGALREGMLMVEAHFVQCECGGWVDSCDPGQVADHVRAGCTVSAWEPPVATTKPDWRVLLHIDHRKARPLYVTMAITAGLVALAYAIAPTPEQLATREARTKAAAWCTTHPPISPMDDNWTKALSNCIERRVNAP